jgi:hypothetical protein
VHLVAGATRHSTIVPASMSAPSDGIRNSPIAAHHPARGGDDVVHLRQGRLLEVRA